MTVDPDSSEKFSQLFVEFLSTVVTTAPAVESPVVATLREHFDAEPTSLSVVTRSFPVYERPNIQLALDLWLSQHRRRFTLTGFGGRLGPGMNFSSLLMPAAALSPAVTSGPVEYSAVPTGIAERMQCVQLGLYLVREGRARVGILVRGPQEYYSPEPQMFVDVIANDRNEAGAVIDSLVEIARDKNCYRGKVVSVRQTNRGTNLDFHRLPSIERDGIVLAPGVLERIEAHTIGFSIHAVQLRRARRHLRRGLLLYGPPGTGKTLSVMYLAKQMPERTIFLLAGGDMAISAACAMARELAPSLVVLEDVDLVAEDRTRSPAGRTPLLFTLMNEMDGLDDDEDVIFVLTTNRADLLEPALAARPGRVDDAIEIGLPDATSRRRLIELYGQGLDLRVSNLEEFVARTEGVSAAFIKELMRKAAVSVTFRTASSRRTLVVDDRALDEALISLEQGGATLRTALVGEVQELTDPPVIRE